MATTGVVKQSSDRPDGSRYVQINYTTDAGDVVVQYSVLPQTQNLNTWMAARIPEIEASLAEEEINRILSGKQ